MAMHLHKLTSPKVPADRVTVRNCSVLGSVVLNCALENCTTPLASSFSTIMISATEESVSILTPVTGEKVQ